MNQGTMTSQKESKSMPPNKRKVREDYVADGNKRKVKEEHDALSHHSNDSSGNSRGNKKQKKDNKQEAVKCRSGSFDSDEDKPKRSSPNVKDDEIRDDSESKKSKEMGMGDFIDIEKAQYTFPERLFELLENGTVKKAMWWLPGGEAFALVPNTFYDVVLAKYFQGTKFESFTRKLNRWGFKRLSGQGVPKGTIAYYHKMFQKNKPDLMKKMRSGKSQSDGPEGCLNRGGLDDGFIPAAVDSGATQLPPFLASRLPQADATSALFAQQAGLLNAGSVTAADNAFKLQLLSAQQQLGSSSSSLAAARQLLAQEQRAALAQLQTATSEATFRRQAELLALEEIRMAQAQEAALAQAQLRARLLQQQVGMALPQTQTSAGLSLGGQTQGATEDQIRMFLLRRQLGRSNGAW